ncbi:MAG: hypothetical protein AB9856_00905 [Cellulosilyticaceae bacterium]
MKKKFIYDIRMANFYIVNGCPVLETGIHKKTKKTFWVFDWDSSYDTYSKWCQSSNSEKSTPLENTF